VAICQQGQGNGINPADTLPVATPSCCIRKFLAMAILSCSGRWRTWTGRAAAAVMCIWLKENHRMKLHFITVNVKFSTAKQTTSKNSNFVKIVSEQELAGI